MNEWCFRPRFCTCEAILGRGPTYACEMNFVMNHAPGAGLWYNTLSNTIVIRECVSPTSDSLCGGEWLIVQVHHQTLAVVDQNDMVPFVPCGL